MTRQAPIAERTIGEYLAALGSSQPAPGGGSVAGLTGALAAGLGQMVVSLTLKGGSTDPVLAETRDQLQATISELLASSEADELAYAKYVDASRLSKATDDETKIRRAAMQAALIDAAEVPIRTATTACDLLRLLGSVVAHGTSHALSDAEIAISLAHAAVTAALVNVRINIPLIRDAAVAADLAERADDVDDRAESRAESLRTQVSARRNA